MPTLNRSAAGYYRTALAACPSDRDSLFRLGQALRLEGKADAARSYLEAAARSSGVAPSRMPDRSPVVTIQQPSARLAMPADLCGGSRRPGRGTVWPWHAIRPRPTFRSPS